ncbi:hypothetical protein BDA99DRAFT_192203 [Phascolomyces articulosus]|uniref:A-kinase anchor protein 7-like phosphoesterase domain-containing protein n=1 Tax=Phascolomyces articulosus TaxID=60185 RepID=A0AAD5KMN4_9FUNG|nr:hypothetical protein BDA99DRAFT_192203 [Phascolomyces articulosus]
MGSSVGQEFNAKPIESRTMPIPLFIRDIELIKGTRSYNIRRIEKYSGTTLTFFKSHRLDPTYHLRIDGSVEQQYFALQALNAVIAETHPTRKYYILLKVTGFKLQEVHTRINHVLEMTTMGQAYQINHSDLHITVAFLNLETSEGLDCLRTTLETAANDLREAYHNDGIRYGHLDAIAKCNENYMSLKPRNGNDSLYWIRDVIWKRMKRNRIIPQNAIPPMLHMTIARKTRKNKMNAYNPYGVPLTQHFLDSLNVDVDFGPIRVSAITIDEVTRNLLQWYDKTIF